MLSAIIIVILFLLFYVNIKDFTRTITGKSYFKLLSEKSQDQIRLYMSYNWANLNIIILEKKSNPN